MDIALPSVVSVDVEESEEILDFLEGENGILGDNILSENGLSLFFDDFFLIEAHFIKLIRY